MDKAERIQQLKKEKNAVIMAHYYVADEVQAIADYVGDSYFLSEKATQVDAQTIVFCGVAFMGESAKILNPGKTVLMPDASADCPMAHMADVEKIRQVRRDYPDVAVVCYVNSTAELKMHSDVCVTSSNALKIVKALPNKYIYFIPDKFLGQFVAEKCPEKEFIFNDGCCPVHHDLTVEAFERAKAARPKAQLLVHPECRSEVSAMADYAGSTAGIINYAGESTAQEFIIGTEVGVLYELKKRYPEKTFYIPEQPPVCADMKKITLDKVITALETMTPEVALDKEDIAKARAPLARMLELAKVELR